MFLMSVLTLAEGLCCACFIYPILCWCRCPEIGTSFINLGQLSRLSPEDGDRIQSPKRCVLKKNKMMDYVQKHNNCTSQMLKLVHRTAPRQTSWELVGSGTYQVSILGSPG
jgi:hypothetical protein